MTWRIRKVLTRAPYEELAAHSVLNALGPDVMTPNVDRDVAARRIAAMRAARPVGGPLRKRSVGDPPALATRWERDRTYNRRTCVRRICGRGWRSCCCERTASRTGD